MIQNNKMHQFIQKSSLCWYCRSDKRREMIKEIFDKFFSWSWIRPFQWCKNHCQTPSSQVRRAVPAFIQEKVNLY